MHAKNEITCAATAQSYTRLLARNSPVGPARAGFLARSGRPARMPVPHHSDFPPGGEK